MRRLLLSSLPVTAAAFVLLAAPVAATQPQVTTFVITDSYGYDCGEYHALVEFSATIRETTFFDADGAPTLIRDMLFLEGPVTNSVTGLTLRGVANYSSWFDLATGDQTVNGGVYHLTRPGAGIVVLDAGRVVFGGDDSLTLAGPHQVLLQGEEALFCQAVA